jgi:hypothetical protein
MPTMRWRRSTPLSDWRKRIGGKSDEPWSSPTAARALRRIGLAALVILSAGTFAGALVWRSTTHPATAGRSVRSSTQILVSDALLSRPQEVPTSAPRTQLPNDCVPHASGPPDSSYQLGLVGRISNGVLDTGTARVADITAKFCAVVTIVNGTPPCKATGSVDSPQDGQVFGSLTAELTLIPGLTPTVPFAAHPGSITGGFSCDSSSSGLIVDLDATVSGSTGLFGASCTIGPFTVPLTGVLVGPITDAAVTLHGDDFTVPAVSASSKCPGNVPLGFDQVAGLPIPRGQATITLPATAYLYRP